MKNIKSNEGTIMKNPPANWYASDEFLKANKTCAGNVRFCAVRMLAANTSFQDMTKVKMADAAIGG